MPRALVTGGGKGIGRCIALALARRGYEVALAGRRTEPLEKVAAELRALGQPSLVIQADLSQATGREALHATIVAHWDGLDVLVNNAGVLASGALAALSAEEIEQAVTTNLTAPLDLTRRFLPQLTQQRGTVVMLNSGSANNPFPYMSLYGGTKAGLLLATEALRFELRPLGIKLLTAIPPFTSTDMTTGMREASNAWFLLPASPEKVGEQIVQALVSGREQIYCGWSDWVLAQASRFTPRMVRMVLRWQQWRFEKMTER
jgi:short-subunit dehydrogenase